MAASPAEECRVDVLAFLAERPRLAYNAEAIQRHVTKRGADYSFTDIVDALAFLLDAELVKVVAGQIISTLHYQVTSAGVLAHERGTL